jgi:hypothetical protein
MNGPVVRIIVALDGPDSSLGASLCAVTILTSIVAIIMPENISASLLCIDVAARDGAIAGHRVVLDKPKLFRAEPRIISPRSVAVCLGSPAP